MSPNTTPKAPSARATKPNAFRAGRSVVTGRSAPATRVACAPFRLPISAGLYPGSPPLSSGRRARPTGMRTGGLSKERLGRLHDVMAGYVDRGEVPSIVTLVSRRGELH